MRKKQRQPEARFVPHPRYGAQPLPSGFHFSEEEILRAHWRYRWLDYFPETAIPANISRQHYAIFPRKLYLDIALTCDTCQRRFIFFAKEQRYWFEELGFWVDAHCTTCVECRGQQQQIRFWQRRYQQYVMQTGLSKEQTREFKQIALELYQRGYLRDVAKVNAIKLPD